MKCCKCCSSTCSVVSIVTCIIVSSIGWILKLTLPGVVENAILGYFVISKDWAMYEQWVEPPFAMHANFYVFNYTNYGEYATGWSKKGIKPKVQQLGPYVFRLSMRRTNITFFGKDEVEYILVPDFEFVPEMSNGTADDVIIFPNIILRAVVQHPMARTAPFLVSGLLGMMNYSYFPFVKHRIGELLDGGFNDPILSQIKDMTGISFGKDGSFKLKDILFQANLRRIKTGASNYKEFGQTVAFKNKTILQVWPKGSRCNEIFGSDLGPLPPKLPTDEKIHMFIGELCRSFFLQFEKEVDHYGIKANRFILDPDVMSNTNTEYECFCKSRNNKCWGAGVLNIGQCIFDAPVLLSLPHMLNTAFHIKNAIDGLAPDPEQHQFFMDLEKTTSLPINASIGLQVNIAIEPTPWLREANNLPEIILPLVFVKNAVDLNETLSAMIKTLVIDLPEGIPIVIWGIGQFIGTLGILCSLYLMLKPKKSSVQPITNKEQNLVVNSWNTEEDQSKIMSTKPTIHHDFVKNTEVDGINATSANQFLHNGSETLCPEAIGS